MKREFQPAFVWALFLAGLTGAQFVFFEESYAYWLLGGAALVTVLIGLYLLWFRSRETAFRHVPDLSYPTVVLAVGTSMAVIGAVFGPWLWLPGLGLAVLGLAGVARELLAERELKRP